MKWMLLALLAGCDPGWKIENPATAPRTIDAACVEAGVRAWSAEVKATPSIHGERVDLEVRAPPTAPYPIHVVWNRDAPSQIDLAVYSLGMHADPMVLAGYRTVRDEIAAHVSAACGTPITLGRESCQRCN